MCKVKASREYLSVCFIQWSLDLSLMKLCLLEGQLAKVKVGVSRPGFKPWHLHGRYAYLSFRIVAFSYLKDTIL
jgi:hypothetical protein